MRNHLYDNGVYIWKGRGKNVAKALFEVKENELPWPENVTNPALSHSKITTVGAVPALPIVTTAAGDNIIRQPVRSVQPVQNHGSELVPNSSPTAVAPMRDNNEVISTEATTTVARTPFGSTSLQSERNNRPRSNLSTLFKVYTSTSDKSSGSLEDNFDRKIAIFHERCDQNDVDYPDRGKAFSIMLSGYALQYYFDSIKGSAVK